VRVTIGVPVYNGERYLRETFECIAAQTFSDFEVVISDNASTDGTEEICRDFAARDRRVRYVRNLENVGMAANFEQLVRLARGDYFKLANADDRFDARLIAECVTVLDARPEVALCYGKTTLIDEDGKTIRQHEDNLHLPEPKARTRFWLALERQRLVNVIHGVVRTAALRRAGPLGTYVGADMVLVPAISLHGQFWELPEHLFYRRMHSGASSSIHTDAGNQEFWNPLRLDRAPLEAWPRFGGYIRAIARAPLAPGEKLRLLAGVGRRAITFRGALAEELGIVLTRWARRTTRGGGEAR
jgi:glycosyltransferase involved in cell wall biosynthesis